MVILLETEQFNRFSNYVKAYFDTVFGTNELYWTYDEDEFGNPDETKYIFYIGNFSDTNVVFEWISEDYFDEEDYEYRKVSPIVIIKKEQSEDFNSLFGRLWKPIFKEWFKENFNLNVKTIK
jgi:hypothetical protein